MKKNSYIQKSPRSNISLRLLYCLYIGCVCGCSIFSVQHVNNVQYSFSTTRGQFSQVCLFFYFSHLSPSLLSSSVCFDHTLSHSKPVLALQPWQITATAFVGRANYTTCHVGRVAGSTAHGRFSGFNYISLAGH